MNTIIISSIDVPLERWLQFGLESVEKHIPTSALIVVAGVVFFMVLAWAWGCLWNKHWNLLKNGRWLAVFLLAFVSAAALATGDALCNGGLNIFSDTSNEISVAFNGDKIKEEEAPAAYAIAKAYVKRFPGVNNLDDEGANENEISFSENSRRSYSTALSLLTWTSIGCLLLILLSVPWVSYSDIREIYPVSIDKK